MKTEQLLIRWKSFDAPSWRQSMGVAGHLLLSAGHPRPCRVVPLPCSPATLPLPFWKSCQLPGCGSREMAGSCSHHHSPALAGQTFGLQWHCSHLYCTSPKCLPPQIPTKEHWVAWDVYRLFLVLQLFPPNDEVRWVSSGLGQLHTLLSPSAQSPGAVVGDTGFRSCKGLPASDSCCAIAFVLHFSQLGH